MGNLVTGKVRFSYVNVFEPRVTPNGDPKYSVTLLIPKTSTNTYQRITNAINQCLQDNLQGKFNGVMPANPRLPIHDGDGLRESGEAYGQECKGHWVMTANSINQPTAVDAQGNPIISKTELYSGCYGRASLRFYAYNQNGNKGIGCGLGNIQKLEEGQPLDGRTTAEEDFANPYIDEDDAGSGAAQPASAPITPNPVQAQTVSPIPQVMGQAVQNVGQIDPITGQPLMQPTVGNIYGIN